MVALCHGVPSATTSFPTHLLTKALVSLLTELLSRKSETATLKEGRGAILCPLSHHSAR